MKKLVFTIQMVALIAMFPVYLVAELNHEKVKSPVENPASAIEETTEKNNVETISVDADEQISFLKFR